MKQFALFILLTILAYSLQAQEQEPEEDMYALSLEELMSINISVSKSDLSLRETPSVISIVTRDEIQKMGARDLMDILNQVPGLNVGIDVQNVVGIGSRGNWGHEGKILLLLDGQEMNEIIFSTTQFGQHYDITNIERIEIIRGPGSSIYGGYAELGVINIITRKGVDLKGLSVSGLYGHTDNTTSRTGLSLNVGNNNKNVDYSLSGTIGKSIRSDQTYTDIYGNTADLTNKSDLLPLMLNAGIQSGKFSARVIYDQYSIETVDQFDLIIDPNSPDKISFKQLFAEAKYELKASEKLGITPKINFKTGTPWKTAEDAIVPYLLDASRLYPSINISWNPTTNTSIVSGLDSYFDFAKYTGDDPDYFGDFSNNNKLTFYNIGIFAQAIFKTNVANITAGARFDSHSQFGTAFSPRIGVTKAYDKFHFKLLYNRAFRSPALENMNYNPDIKPERTGVAELELGYKFNSNMFLTGNIYHIQISDPIVYFVDTNNPVGFYDNFEKAGSLGLELDYRLKYSWGYVNMNYAFYSAKDLNKVPYYQIPNDEKQVLAMPGNRVNLLASINVGKSFSINPSLNLIGERYAITELDVNDNYVYQSMNSEAFVNLYLHYRKQNFEGGIGVYDILDEGQKFIQPYASGHAILPGIGREFIIKITYQLSFK